MDGSIGSDTATADVERLVGELAGVKGENVQLLKRLALLEGEEERAARLLELEGEVRALRELVSNYDCTVDEIYDLAELEPGDQGSALYRLGKIAAICESVPELEPNLTAELEREDEQPESD